MSFRLQIALVFGAVVLALILVLSALLARLQAQTVRDAAGRALQVVANNAQRALADGLAQRLAIVEGLAGSASLWRNGLASDDVRAALMQQQLVGSHLAWLGVARRDGFVAAATGGLLVGVYVHARPWFAAGLDGIHVGDVHDALLLARLLPPSVSGEPQRFVDFAAPIRVDGRLVGVLALHGSWDWTRSVIESQLPDDAQAMAMDLFVFDRHGIAIYVPPPRDDVTIRLGDRLPAGIGTDRTASVVRWPNGRDYLTSAAPLKARNVASDLGWTVVARTPEDLAYAPVRQAVRHVVLLGLFAATIATALAWVVAGTVSKPLSAIERAAQDVLRGKRGATIPKHDGSAELQRLSSALIEMTADLETRVRDHDRLARYDPLTTLLNRRGFDERLEAAIHSAQRRGSPLSVIAIDVDHFKTVNDRHGHHVGDAVLRSLGSTLQSWFRETDIVARMGGEEFIVVAVDTDLAQTRILAEELVRHVSSIAFPVTGSITISCGVSKLIDGESTDVSLKRADRALYRAKSDGRNRTVTIGDDVEADAWATRSTALEA